MNLVSFINLLKAGFDYCAVRSYVCCGIVNLTKPDGTLKNRAGRKGPAKKTYGDAKTNNYKLGGVDGIDRRVGRD